MGRGLIELLRYLAHVLPAEFFEINQHIMRVFSIGFKS